MNLKAYRNQNNVKMAEIAGTVGKTVQHLYEIERGIAKPSAPLALRIEEATGGQVSRMELLYPEQTSSKCGEDSESSFQVASALPPPVKLRGLAPVPGLLDTPPHKTTGANKSRKKS
jgi:transcriptional regulator with XRE-family HTH domain